MPIINKITIVKILKMEYIPTVNQCEEVVRSTGLILIPLQVFFFFLVVMCVGMKVIVVRQPIT